MIEQSLRSRGWVQLERSCSHDCAYGLIHEFHHFQLYREHPYQIRGYAHVHVMSHHHDHAHDHGDYNPFCLKTTVEFTEKKEQKKKINKMFEWIKDVYMVAELKF